MNAGSLAEELQTNHCADVTLIWEIGLAGQRTTRTVLPGRVALPLLKAFCPSASGKV